MNVGSRRLRPQDCLLLISDHMSKVLTAILQDALMTPYLEAVGDTQFGAVPRQGTAGASLSLQSFIATCNLFMLSYFVLFVDLSKAFDYAVREVIMGWIEGTDASREGRRQRLCSVGIPDEYVEDVLQWLLEERFLALAAFCPASCGGSCAVVAYLRVVPVAIQS